MNSSVVNNTTTYKPPDSATANVPLIVGLTIGVAAFICILICLCYYAKNKSKRSKKQPTTRRAESLTDIYTLPTSPRETGIPVRGPRESPKPIHPISHEPRVAFDRRKAEVKFPPIAPTEVTIREKDRPYTPHGALHRRPSAPGIHRFRSSSVEIGTPNDNDNDHYGSSKRIPTPLKQLPPDPCPKDICKQYSVDLRMNGAYFNLKHNKCFCLQCYPNTKTDRFTVAGSPYTVPRGWTRFGLQIDQAFADAKQIFKQWYTTFHGISREKLELILRERFIPFPGDSLLSGEKFTTHLPDKKHVYTSPSIHYASLRHMCPIHTTKINNQWYDVRVVLECKQNPEGIIKQHGCRRNVCRLIPDNEIEWKTNQRSSVVPYGLLIRAQKHRCTDECAHSAIADTPGYKHRVDVKPNDDLPAVSNRCPQDTCKQYSVDLRMNGAYFNLKHNKCFCLQCYPNTKTDRFTVAGSPYTAPRGWTRFGLQIDQAFADAKQIFKQWYTTFYGTSRDKLELILRERFIPFPGDSLLSGKVFTVHLPDKKHVYTSPSIHYAGLRHICPIHTTKINNQWYDVQVVLECKQNPEGIIKQRGYKSNVCRIISDDEIEWKTNQRSSVVPYGLLIRAREHRCTGKCAARHSS